MAGDMNPNMRYDDTTGWHLPRRVMDAWDILEPLIGSVESPPTWAEGHMNQESTNEELNLSDLDPDHRAAYCLALALHELKTNKPNDRTAVDRHWAIALTELEKVIAYFDYWVCRYTDDAPPVE